MPLDTSAAQFYDSVLVPEVFQPWAENLVERAQLREGMRTLDVACGTGIVARCAAEVCGKSGCSSGADIDPAMIEVARAAALRAGLGMDFRCAPVTELPFDPDTFDAVLCQQGLQYFPDLHAALRELHRVMRPGARLIAAVWTEMETTAGNWAMIGALEKRGIDASHMRKPFALSDAAALRAHALQAGFADASVEVTHLDVRFPGAKTFVEQVAQGAPSSRQALANVPPQSWQDFIVDVEAQLAPFTRNGRLEFTMASNVLVAHRSAQ